MVQLFAIWLGNCHAVERDLTSDENAPPFIFGKGRREALLDGRSSENAPPFIFGKGRREALPERRSSKNRLMVAEDEAVSLDEERNLSSDENIPPLVLYRLGREALPGRRPSSFARLTERNLARKLRH